MDISQFIDVEAERARLEKQHNEFSKHIATMEAKLSNENFVSRAPADVVQKQRDKLTDVQGQLVSIQAALEKLGNTD